MRYTSSRSEPTIPQLPWLGKFTAFDGEIDDFAAWYRALSDSEIAMLYELAVTKQMNAGQVDHEFRDACP